MAAGVHFEHGEAHIKTKHQLLKRGAAAAASNSVKVIGNVSFHKRKTKKKKNKSKTP